MSESQGSRTLRSSDLLELRFVSAPRVAPGGRLVAAVISEIVSPEDEQPPGYRSTLHLFTPTGGCWRVDEATYSDSRPRFSPDGKSLAFLRRPEKEKPAQLMLVDLRQLHELDKSSASETQPAEAVDLAGGKPPSTVPARQISDEPAGVESFDWHPSGRKLAYLAREKRAPDGVPAMRSIDRLRHRLDGKGYLADEPRRVMTIELGDQPAAGQPATAASRLAGTGDLDFEELAWSGDGRSLLLSAAADRSEWERSLRRLWRFETASGELSELLGPRRLAGLSASPDGRAVAFLAPARNENVAGPSALWLTEIPSGVTQRISNEDDELSPGAGGDSRYGEHPNTPQWLDGGGLLVNLNREGSSGLALLDPETSDLSPFDSDKAVVSSFHHADRVVALVRETSSRPGELYLAPVAGPVRALTTLNLGLAERFDFRPASGPFTPARNSSAAYWRIDPAVARPDRALVVQVHGGPHTNVGSGFYFEFQLLAAHGYTVIYGNPHGSSSYGYDFATSILGSYGTIDADDVISFVDHALARHPEPSAPVHLTGGSYGGFMTNWLVAHGDRFRSAVTQRSISNFASFYGTSDIGYDFSERELGGNPWLDADKLWLQSPLRLAHRIATPLLIIHSEGDQRCPLEQAQQLFVAVKQAGTAETKLLIFPEESHELSRSGRPDRRVLRLDAIVDWFRAHA